MYGELRNHHFFPTRRSVDLYVYVFVPAHGGSGLITGADGVSVLPQLSVTTGGVGATAADGHATVDDPFFFMIPLPPRSILLSYKMLFLSSHAVYVYVYVFVPAHGGSGLITGADGVIVLPQLSVTTGGVGATAADGHANLDDPPAGIVTVGGLNSTRLNSRDTVLSQAVYLV